MLYLSNYHRLAVIILAGSLLYLGIPRFISAIILLPSGPILHQIQKNQSVSLESLQILIESQKRGLEWSESSRRWSDLGLAQILAANKTENAKHKTLLISEAQTSLINGLSMGPSNAYAWTRLALAEMSINGISSKAAEFLVLAIDRAPHDRSLVFSRLRLCLLSWSQFDRSGKLSVMDQLRFAWEIDPKRMVKVAAETKQIAVARAALLTISDEIPEFNIRLQLYHNEANQK